MNYPNEYEKYKKLSTDELAEIMGGREEIASKSNIARLVYEQRQMEQQDKYNKEQIELQHSLNKQVADKQSKITIICTIVQASATLLAAIAGAYLAYTLSKLKDQPEIKLPVKQTVQSQTVISTSASRAGQKTDKVPLSPPK